MIQDGQRVNLRETGVPGPRRAGSTAPLRTRLGDTYRRHDLNRHELMAVQRAIHRLQRSGDAPTPDRFWSLTAQPRAQRLVTEACAVIDEELRVLAAGGHLATLDEAAVVDAVPSTDAIDELGRWWQRRLRRAATLRALPDLAAGLPGAVELTIAHHEMDLLDRPPWSHGDRLLSAFELAHAQIRRHSRDEARRLGIGSPLPRHRAPAAG